MIVDMETHTLYKRTETLIAKIKQHKEKIQHLQRDVEELRSLIADLFREKAALKYELRELQKNVEVST